MNLMATDVTKRQAEAFRRFLTLLPHGKDTELVLLKGHLLIEEQIHQIIKERLKNPDALKDARIECHQAICLAQSLFPLDYQPWLWDALKKLNTLRNKVAHNIEPNGLGDRIEYFVTAYPWGYAEIEDKVAGFELSLWSMFCAVAELAETPSAKVLELINRDVE